MMTSSTTNDVMSLLEDGRVVVAMEIDERCSAREEKQAKFGWEKF